MAAKKKSGGSSGGSALRDVVASSVSTDALIDLVERLGLVDLVMSRIKAKIEETDVDELFEDITEYLKRNPEVLVVSLGAITVATGMLVWLNSRREQVGADRNYASERSERNEKTTTSSGRVRKAS